MSFLQRICQEPLNTDNVINIRETACQVFAFGTSIEKGRIQKIENG